MLLHLTDPFVWTKKFCKRALSLGVTGVVVNTGENLQIVENEGLKSYWLADDRDPPKQAKALFVRENTFVQSKNLDYLHYETLLEEVTFFEKFSLPIIYSLKTQNDFDAKRQKDWLPLFYQDLGEKTSFSLSCFSGPPDAFYRPYHPVYRDRETFFLPHIAFVRTNWPVIWLFKLDPFLSREPFLITCSKFEDSESFVEANLWILEYARSQKVALLQAIEVWISHHYSQPKKVLPLLEECYRLACLLQKFKEVECGEEKKILSEMLFSEIKYVQLKSVTPLASSLSVFVKEVKDVLQKNI